MSFDEHLRSALFAEADRPAPPLPDIARLVSGGRARRRRRNLARLGGVLAAVVLLGGAGFGVAQISPGEARTDPAVANQPSSSTAATPRPYRDIDSALPEPGTYRKLVGIDEDSGAPIEVDLTFRSPRWHSGSQPVLTEVDASGSENSVGLGILEPQTLAGGRSGCTVDGWQPAHTRKAAGTPAAVARQLARLPRSSVVQPPSRTEAFGHHAVHVALEVDGDCGEEIYLLAEADTGPWGISYSAVQKVMLDVLVVDVGGTPVIVASWRHPEASPELVEELARVRDSISFVTD